MDTIDEIKRANPIEAVIEATGVSLQGHGRYLRGQEHDSLVVDCHEEYFVWNSKSENGDVITWMEIQKWWDFKTAVEWLAQRAHMQAPDWGREDNTVRLATRAREDALTVAARVYVKRLRGNSPTTAYCEGRGWDAETVRQAGLGYTGDGTSEERKDREGELDLHQVEKENPGRRAALGIPAKMLVYPHVVGGRVRYLSCRSIIEKIHYNLPKDLVGPRQVYFNWIYSARDETCVIVEGQADAVTLGQWGLGAVALAGTSWKDHGGLLKELRERHRALYIALDADEAGEKALRGKDDGWEMAFALGAMARVVRWGEFS